MVCGRPPFVGDESVAIISSAPQYAAGESVLAPSRYPAGPGSADSPLAGEGSGQAASSRVGRLQALAAIDLEASPPRPRDRAVPVGAVRRTRSSTSRRSWVARQEVRQIQAAYDAAVSGQGSLVTVVGEPGIGKTALCEQLATYVAVRGGERWWATVTAKAPHRSPICRSSRRSASTCWRANRMRLRSELGRRRGPGPHRLRGPRTPPGRAATRAVTRRKTAGDSCKRSPGSCAMPVACSRSLLVLEDLHWADRGTLDLLLHVARNLAGARLLWWSATYRDVEVDRAHPLSSGPGRAAARSATFMRVALRGLTVDEVHRMMQSDSGTGNSLEPGGSDPPSDRGQSTVRPGSAALHRRGGPPHARGRPLGAHRRRASRTPAYQRGCAM